MAVEPITEKILSDARREAERIRREYGAKAQATLEQAKKEAAMREATELERLKIELEREYNRILALARVEAKKRLLAAKRSIIDRVFKAAEEEILNDEEYPKLLKGIIDRHGEKGNEILLSELDRKRLKLPELGGPAPIRGGVIIRSGRIEKNFSLDAIIESLKDELTVKLAELLFEGGV